MPGTGWPEIVAHRERLLAIARRRCPTYEDAEDVVHEAMLRCATFASLDPERLGQFLTTVTIRLCVDVYRESERSSRAVSRLAPDRDLAPSPEEAACGSADARYIESLIATLPARQRDVLADRALGLSMTQICARHALSYKAAESALARARGTLRGALAAAFGALALLAASLRRHRVAIAAVPVASLVVAGAVLRLPLAPPQRLLAIPPPAGRAPRAAGPATPRVAERRPHRVPGVASVAPQLFPRLAATWRRPVAPPAPPSSGEVLVIGDDDAPVRARVTDKRKKEPPQDTVARCLDEGVWVTFDDGLLNPKQGCGPAPTEGDS